MLCHIEYEGEPFEETMARLTKRLEAQFEEGVRLESIIRQQLQGVVYAE